MNIDSATQLLTRMKLTQAEPFRQPAFVIAHAMVNKQMDYLSAYDWVQAMFREGVFFRYEGTWDNVLQVLHTYREMKQ